MTPGDERAHLMALGFIVRAAAVWGAAKATGDDPDGALDTLMNTMAHLIRSVFMREPTDDDWSVIFHQ